MKNTKSVLAIFAIIISLFCLTACKSDDYEAAVSLYDSGDYEAAVSAFSELEGFKDSAYRAQMAQTAADYEAAEALYDSGDYAAAVSAFTELGDYEDSAERAAEAQVVVDVIEIEDFAAKNSEIYFYSKELLDSFPDWGENYALYSQFIENGNEESDALAVRFKNALGDIEELKFNIAVRLDRDFDLLEEIVSNIETLGFNEKAEELNKQIAKMRYLDFYDMSESGSYFVDEITEIAIFPDSEVKTITQEALNLWQELNSESDLTRENVERSFNISEELKGVADTLHDLNQPDYYLKNCLLNLADHFEDYGYDNLYYNQCHRSMEEKITPELEAYYEKTTAGKAPIEITGNELYIAPFTYNDTSRNFGTSDLSNEIFTEDPKLYMHLASKPEEARYLINFSGTASFYGNYTYAGTSSLTKSYSVKVTMYLKDCKTGEILYTQNFSATPPFSINVSGIPKEYYASVSWDDDDLDKFLAVLLPKLGIE